MSSPGQGALATYSMSSLLQSSRASPFPALCAMAVHRSPYEEI
jgi:hypothetical protein